MPTHAHYKEEFGPRKKAIAKAIAKAPGFQMPAVRPSTDPVYRASRAIHHGKRAMASEEKYHSAKTDADRAQHTADAKHASSQASKHAEAVKNLSTDEKLVKNASQAAKMADGSHNRLKVSEERRKKLAEEKKADTRAEGSAAKAENHATKAEDHRKEAEKHAAEAKDHADRAAKHAAEMKLMMQQNEKMIADAKIKQEQAAQTSNVAQDAHGGMQDADFHNFRKDFHKKLTEQETRAAYAYSEDAYVGINDGLRKDQPGHNATIIGHLDSMIAKSSIPNKSVIFRGAGGEEVLQHYGHLRPGDSYTEKAFSSASAKHAQDFQRKSSVVMRITMEKGSKGAPIPSASLSESEIVLPRNQKFRVDRVEHGIFSEGPDIGKPQVTMHVTAIQE